MTDRAQSNPTDAPQLIRDLVKQGTRLFRDEVALARREVGRNVSRAGAGLVMMGVAAILLLTALNLLAGAAVTMLVQVGLSVPLASLAIGAGALLVAAVLFFLGKARLDPKKLAPERAMAGLRRDVETIKEKSHV